MFPRSGSLTAWANAYLAGTCSLDEADVGAVGADALHRIVGLPGETEPVALSVGLGRLRGAGVTALRLVLPVAGDPTGLPGPAQTTIAAIAAGEVAVTVAPPGGPTWALVPQVAGEPGSLVVRWEVLVVDHSAPPHGLPSLGEAERGLAEAMSASTTTLAALDVAKGRDDIGPRLSDLDRRMRELQLPSGFPQRAHRMILSAVRLSAVVSIAEESDGAAVSASEVTQRGAALRPLRTAARYALCAGYSAHAEEAAVRDLRGA